MQIRLAKSADIKTIARFNQAMALETEDKVLVEEVILNGVTRIIENKNLGFYLVAEQDAELLGCLAITFEWSDWRNGLFWWIQSVYICPKARRSGVFKQLYQTVRKQAQQDTEVCGIRLYVERDNGNAIKTYLNLGMTETHYRIMEEEF